MDVSEEHPPRDLSSAQAALAILPFTFWCNSVSQTSSASGVCFNHMECAFTVFKLNSDMRAFYLPSGDQPGQQID
jgi:hypothetical protein